MPRMSHTLPINPLLAAVVTILVVALPQLGRESGAEGFGRRASGHATTPQDALTSLVQRFRESPDDEDLQEAVLVEAEALLRRGAFGLAERCFADVATHSRDAERADRAWLGRYTAAAEISTLEEADALWERMPETCRRQLSQRRRPDAGQQRARFAAAFDAKAPASTLRLPAATPWPLQSLFTAPSQLIEATPSNAFELVSLGDRLVAASPGLIAVFEPGGTLPVWWITTPEKAHDFTRGRTQTWLGEYLVIPGRFRPTGDARRLMTRWNIDTATGQLRDLVSFDLDSGRLLWSTADDPRWADHSPVGDPVFSEGRVYCLRIRRGVLSQFELAALDADSGRTLWVTPLSQDAFELTYDYRDERKAVDVVTYGSGVAVAHGAVFCVTNAAQVARVDARDGRIEWNEAYDRVQDHAKWRQIHKRRGGSPQIAGQALIVTPRDALTTLALDIDTGQRLWSADQHGGEWIVSVGADRLILGGGDAITSLDPANGQLRWRHAAGSELVCVTEVSSDRLIYSALDASAVVDADTGEQLAEYAWPFPGPADAMAMTGNGLTVVTPEPAGQSAISAEGETEDATRFVWSLSRSGPHVHAVAADGAMLVQSGAVLECLTPNGERTARWQRIVPSNLRNAVITDHGLAMLIFHDSVMGIDLKDGQQRWLTRVPFRELAQADRHSRLIISVHGRYGLIRMIGPNNQPIMMIDTRTGESLWNHLDGVPSLRRVVSELALWGQEEVVLLGRDSGSASLALPLRLSDGRPGKSTRLSSGGESGVGRIMQLDGDRLVYLNSGNGVVLATVRDTKPEHQFRVPLPGDFGNRPYRAGESLTLDRHLVLVEKHRQETSLSPQWFLVDLDRREMVKRGANEVVVLGDGRAWRLDSIGEERVLRCLYPEGDQPGDMTYLRKGPVPESLIEVRRIGQHWVALSRVVDHGVRLDAWKVRTGESHGVLHLSAYIADIARLRPAMVRQHRQNWRPVTESTQRSWVNDTLILAGDTTIQGIDVGHWLRQPPEHNSTP
jgi:outer membrane protein assembly factor BamB